MSGRTFAIGDIHGCDTALRLLLEKIAPVAGDTVVSLGDIIDRGPGTRQVIEMLLELRQTCKVILIRGNHEESFLNGLEDDDLRFWLMIGGQQALDSYGGSLDKMPAAHRQFLADSLDYYETEKNVFVHATVRLDRPFDQQGANELRWEKFHPLLRPHYSGKRILCGHTIQPKGLPCVIPGWVCLDTWVYGPGYLSALDVEADIVYQTSELGEVREFSLHDLPKG